MHSYVHDMELLFKKNVDKKFSKKSRSKHLEQMKDTLKNEIRKNPAASLFSAIQEEDLEKIQAALQYVEINIENEAGEIPLHMAVQKGNLEIVKYLIQAGADVKIINLKSGLPFTPSDQKNRERSRSNSNPHGPTALYWAIQGKHVAIAEFLIEKGADVKKPDMDGKQPLYLAVISNQPDMVKLLLKSGVQIDAMSDCETALFTAAKLGYAEVFELLIEARADIHFITNGDTLLHAAVNGNHYDIVNRLIACKLNINSKNGRGMTPLHIACEKRNLEIIELLLAHGAQQHLKDREGKTAIEYTEYSTIEEMREKRFHSSKTCTIL